MIAVKTNSIDSQKLQAIELWKRGKYGEARAVLEKALRRELNVEQEISLTINLAQVERGAGNPEKALALLRGIAARVEQYYSPLLKGKFFNQLGAVYWTLGEIDAAFDAYTAASIWYERAREFGLRAGVENNIALLMIETERFPEAHHHLDRALDGCFDETLHAQIDETRARLCMAEGQTKNAFNSILASLVVLKDADEGRLLLESLNTFDVISARLKWEREHDEISRALIEVDGKLKPAADMLGISRQTLTWKLENQHRDLLPLRAPKKKARGRHAVKV